jgi:hypothetical protein
MLIFCLTLSCLDIIKLTARALQQTCQSNFLFGWLQRLLNRRRSTSRTPAYWTALWLKENSPYYSDVCVKYWNVKGFCKYIVLQRWSYGETWPRSSLSLTRGRTDMSRPGMEYSSKDIFEQRNKSYSEYLHMSLRHGSPQCMWLHEHTWGDLECRPNSTCKLFNPEYWHQTLASCKCTYSLSSKTDHVGVTNL